MLRHDGFNSNSRTGVPGANWTLMSEKERKGQGLPRRGSWLSLGERGVLITAGTGVDV